MIARIAPLAIAAVFAVVAAGSAEAGCKRSTLTGNSHAMRGGYFPQTQAASYARQHWRYLCSKRFGVSWCQPSKAANRRTVCRRVSTSGPDRKYLCEFRARPCR